MVREPTALVGPARTDRGMTDQRTHSHTAPAVPAPALRELVDARSRELGLTRDRVARDAGIGRSTLFDWLSGTGQPSAAGWLGLGRALGMSVTAMFDAVGVPLTSSVERARLDRGWTRGELAEAARVSFATVRSLERGDRVRADAAARVGTVLGLAEAFVQDSARVSARATTPLGCALEAERLARGWTIAHLARHLGTARQLVSAWLLGAEPVAARWVPALVEFTGLDEATVTRLVNESRPERSTRPSRRAGEQIREARKLLGWSRADLALRVGVSAATVEQWECGRRAPGHAVRARLLPLLGLGR